MAELLRARIGVGAGSFFGSGLVAVDEIGTGFEDARAGPALSEAMVLLSKQTFAPTGEKLSARVLFYVAPRVVANVGSGHDRYLWTRAISAFRLSGGVYLQMYHARQGRVTSPFSAAEWRSYMPAWATILAPRTRLLRVILSNGRGVPQLEQWRRARQTLAGRRALRNGTGAYRLGDLAEARAWLGNWNKYSIHP